MIKKALVYLPLLVIPLIDQLSKFSISYFLELKNIGPLEFQYQLNQSFLLGAFESLPLFTKSVISCSIFLVLFSLVIYIQLLLIPRVFLLRLSLNSYFAAMFSNCLDKILHLGVKDFITFDGEIIFNLADSIQWIALPLVVYSFFKYSTEIWTPNCLRRSFFLGIRSQMTIVWTFSILVLINLIVVSIFNYSFLTYIGLSLNERLKYLGTLSVFIMALSFVSFVFTVLYSQRIVGPLVSLLSYVKKNKNFDQNYKIRKGDPLVELEEIASLIRKEGNDS